MSSTTVNTIILRALASVLPAAYSAPIRNSAHDPVDPLVPPTSTILHGLVRLIIIVMAVGYATWIRHWLGVTYGVKPAFISYVPLVLGVSALGGPAAGIWATLLSILAADIFLIAPHGTLRIDSAGDRIGLVVFAAAGIAISFTAGSLRRLSIYRKLAAEQLRASQESLASERRQLTSAQRRLAAIVESTDDAIITEDLNGLVTTWNAGAQRMFGYTTGEAVGQPILRFAPPGREHELGEIRQRILHNEHVHNFETIRVARDGRNIHVSATISPIVDEHGVIVGTSRIVRDVTTLRGIERQLRQSQKMDAVGQLTGGIAHDFNNLLAIIVGSLEIQLPQIQDNPAALHPATRAHAAALRGADLTRRLLAFSSVDQSNSAPVQLTKCIRNIMALARPTLGREIETSLLLEDTLAPVIVDSNALENSILNLVLNARDAMPRGGALIVAAAVRNLDAAAATVLNPVMTAGNYACISVTDTGTGMTQEVLDRAFEPFFTTKDRGRGTGLGLAAVYGFARQSNGGVNISSEPNRGTTVSIFLPFATGEPPVEAPEPTPSKPCAANCTVLLIDDEVDLLEVGSRYLKSLGHIIYIAPDAEAALEILRQHPEVRVAVTDIILGGAMDGVELGREINRIFPSVTVVYSSGFSAHALSGKSMLLGDSLMLQKPYRLFELAGIIERAISQR